MVELVDEPGALADDRLQTTGDLAEQPQGMRKRRRGGRSFGDGEAGHGAGLDGIGLLRAEDRGSVVLVALRIAARERDRQRSLGSKSMQEVEQVVGVLSGGVETDMESARSTALCDAFESSAKLGVAVGGLGEREFVGGRLKIVAQKGGVVTVARGVDADAEARQIRRDGWKVGLAGRSDGRRRLRRGVGIG